jgi:hypothetical protein
MWTLFYKVAHGQFCRSASVCACQCHLPILHTHVLEKGIISTGKTNGRSRSILEKQCSVGNRGTLCREAGLWSRYTKAPTRTPPPTPRFLKLPTPTPTAQFLKPRLRLLHKSSMRINNGKPIRRFITTT